MFESTKKVKSTRLPGHGLRYQLASQARQRYPVAAETLKVINVVSQASKIWCPVHADIDKATPDVINRYVVERRKHLGHPLCHGFF